MMAEIDDQKQPSSLSCCDAVELPNEIILQILQYLNAQQLYLNCSRVCKRWRDLIQKSDLVFEAVMRRSLGSKQVDAFVNSSGSLQPLKSCFLDESNQIFRPGGLCLDRIQTVRIEEQFSPSLPLPTDLARNLPLVEALIIRECPNLWRNNSCCYANIGDYCCWFVNLSKFLPFPELYLTLKIPMAFHGGVGSIALFDQDLQCISEKVYEEDQSTVILGMYSQWTRYVGVMAKAGERLSIRLLLPSVAIAMEQARIIALMGLGCCSELR